MELEQVLSQMDDVDIVAPGAPLGPPQVAQRAWRRLRRLPRLEERLRRLELPAEDWLDRDYEVGFVVCQDPSDLLLLGPLGPLRRRCAKLVCWIDELWAHSVPERKGEMELLGHFDLVVLGCHDSVAAARVASGADVRYLPPAVDTIRLCPYPIPPERSIAIYNMGRRSAATHRAMLSLSEERDWLYLFDSVVAESVMDAQEHRKQLAQILRRTRFFVANKAKVDWVVDTQGQEEVGFRFFEGAAAGTVMIGDPPGNETFRELFDWPGAVLELPFGATHVAEVIDSLSPVEEARIRRDNVSWALRRHDWAHRWGAILDWLQMGERPGLAARRETLERLARSVPRREVRAPTAGFAWRGPSTA